MAEDAVIVLGGRPFAVAPFTFDQLRRILPAFARLRQGLSEGGLDAARDIIAAAVEGQLAPEEVARLRTTLPEIVAAIPVIARVSGLADAEDTAPESAAGESGAGAGSPGTISTPASAPTPVGPGARSGA